MRTAVALVLAAGLVGTLAACSTPTPEGTTEDCVASGSVSESVKVSGDFGSEPEITFEAPLDLKETQRSVAIDGKGRVAVTNDIVFVHYSVYNATTGIKIESSTYTDEGQSQFTVNRSSVLVGLAKTLECSQPGSRVVGVIPASEAFGETGAEELKVAPEDSLLFVLDIESVAAGVADGKPVAVEDDSLPTVKLADDGAPTLTIPDSDPPAELKIAVLKQGDGKEVGDGDAVTVHYQGTNWNTNTIFDQSWGAAPTTFKTNEVVAGFGQALVGQKVGSQVLVVIPADLGYGPSGGNEGAGISATDTIVFVIDILATQG